MPGPGDIAPHDIAVLERPAPDGPFGGKGPGEMCANPVLPAVANAIFNAVGVRIDELPITPEKVLRALNAQGGARPQARRARGIGDGGARNHRRHRSARRRWPRRCARRYYLADDGFATAAYLALALGKPLLLEGAPGVGKTEAAKAIAGDPRAAADPAAMLRGHRRRRRALRVELPAPDAGDPPGRRRADRHLSRRVPDRAADAGGAAPRRNRPCC